MIADAVRRILGGTGGSRFLKYAFRIFVFGLFVSISIFAGGLWMVYHAAGSLLAGIEGGEVASSSPSTGTSPAGRYRETVIAFGHGLAASWAISGDRHKTTSLGEVLIPGSAGYGQGVLGYAVFASPHRAWSVVADSAGLIAKIEQACRSGKFPSIGGRPIGTNLGSSTLSKSISDALDSRPITATPAAESVSDAPAWQLQAAGDPTPGDGGSFVDNFGTRKPFPPFMPTADGFAPAFPLSATVVTCGTP